MTKKGKFKNSFGNTSSPFLSNSGIGNTFSQTATTFKPGAVGAIHKDYAGAGTESVWTIDQDKILINYRKGY